MCTLPQPLRRRFWQRAERLKAPKPPLAMVARKDATSLKLGVRVQVKALREELAPRDPEADYLSPGCLARRQPADVITVSHRRGPSADG